jgi:hypothetical protein
MREERENGVSEKTGQPRKKILSPLAPHPKHGRTITEGYRMAAAGRPYAEIARYFNAESLPSAGKETHWHSNRIARLLTNEVYLGVARYGDVRKPGAHPALVDETTFLLAQREKREPSVSLDGAYLLGGIVRCAGCRHALKPQAASGKAIAVYRCPKHHPAGTCPAPSTISMDRLDRYVFEEWSERAFSIESEPRETPDNSMLLEALQEAQAKLSEVLADEDKLRTYGVFEQARDAALDRIEATQRDLASSPVVDVETLTREALTQLEATIARVEAGESPLASVDDNGKRLLRASIASDVQAVFVRPAASRSNKLPIGDRVRIVWADEDPLELPRRGERFEPRAYAW